jgi:hypothetical protein
LADHRNQLLNLRMRRGLHEVEHRRARHLVGVYAPSIAIECRWVCAFKLPPNLCTKDTAPSRPDPVRARAHAADRSRESRIASRITALTTAALDQLRHARVGRGRQRCAAPRARLRLRGVHRVRIDGPGEN